MASLLKYRFHDTPDTQDCFKKAVAIGKISFKWGALLATADVLFTQGGKSNIQKALRYPAYLIPMVGMSTAFVVVMQTTTKLLPSWDHKLHYMLGGWAAAGVWGHCAKSGVLAFNASVFFGGMAAFYQYTRWAKEHYPNDDHIGEMLDFRFPDDYKYIKYEKRQSSSWYTNDLDWRPRKKPERSNNYEYIKMY